MPGANYIIFRNSFQSTLIVPIHSEYAWTAARIFGYDVLTITVMAVMGAMLAMSINYGLGYCLGKAPIKRFNLTEESYLRVSGYFRRFIFLLLLLPGFYVGLIAVACGFFRVKPWIALATVALGRVGFYLYQLLQPLQ